MDKTLAQVSDKPAKGNRLLLPAPDHMRCQWRWKKGDKKGQQCPKYGSLRADGTRKNCCDSHGGKNEGRPPTTYEHVKMPIWLKANIETANADQELQGIKFSKDILMGLMLQCLADMADTQSAAFWKAAKKHLIDLKIAIREKDVQKVTECLQALEGVINNGLGPEKAESKLRDLVQEYRSLEETDIKKRDKLANFIPAAIFGKAFARVLVVAQALFENIDEVIELDGRRTAGTAVYSRLQTAIVAIVSEVASGPSK
jgi:hypothetical protein